MKKVKLFLGLGVALLLSACHNSDDSPNGGGSNGETASSKYILAVKSNAPNDDKKADYLLTVNDIDKGSTSIVGNGIEQDGTYRYYLTTNNKFFSEKYGQAGPGAMTTYILNKKGDLEKVSDFQAETVQAFAPVNNDILMLKISRNVSSPIANWYRLDTNNLQIVDEGQINTKELADKPNGEIAFFSWIKQFGKDKVLLPYLTIKGSGGWGQFFDTEYPNEANVAIFSYPDMKLIKKISTKKVSPIGSYHVNNIVVDEKGDAYTFSPSTRTKDGKITSTNPPAVLRINKNTLDFDKDYYFNIGEKSGGYYVSHLLYTKDGKVLAFFRPIGEKDSFYPGHKLGVVDLYNQTIVWVKGLPAENEIKYLTGMQSYVSKDKKTVSIGVTAVKNSNVYNNVYNIDINSATAQKGIEVQGGEITGISMLSAQ